MKLIDKPLTEQQKRFAELYVYEKGVLSNYEVAIAAGYAQKSAYQRAYELLNPKISPHVVMYISKLKEDWKSKNNIDPDKHMARLNHIGQIAEQNKNYGVTLRAEELRGKVAGYYIDRQIIKTKGKEDMTEKELEEEMRSIINEYSHILNFDEKKEVNKDEKGKK